MRLELGVAKVDITPQHPVPLAGFAARNNRLFEGVQHPLYARILVFHQNVHGVKKQVVLISADLIWWGTDLVRDLRRGVLRKWNLPSECVLFHATHNHSGPQTCATFAPALGTVNQAYVAWLKQRVLAGIAKAFDDLEPVRMRRGSGTCGMAINRRKGEHGKMLLAPNPYGVTDPEVTVVRFLTRNQRTKVVLVHGACHATTTTNLQVSSEFPGVAMSYVEAHVGTGAVAVFLQGFCGDTQPNLVKGDSFYMGDDADVCRLGRELADCSIAVLDGEMKRVPVCKLVSKQKTLELQLQEQEERVAFEMTYLQLAERLSFLAVNAEPVTAYGLFLKQQVSRGILPLGYTNGMIGYIPIAEQIAEGGYEDLLSLPNFRLSAPFVPEIEEQIHKAMIEFVGSRE